MNFDIPVQEEIRILANAMTEAQRKAMFAKMRGGGGDSGGRKGSPYDDEDPERQAREEAYERYKQEEREAHKKQRLADLQAAFDDGIAYLESIGGKHSNGNSWTVDRLKTEWEKAGDNIPRLVALVENANGNLYDNNNRLVSGRFVNSERIREGQLRSRESVELEITERALYLANAAPLTDEQRKAIFAKTGGGSGSGGKNVYTMADTHGTLGGRGNSGPTGPLVASTNPGYSGGAGSGPTGPLTVSSVSDIGGEGSQTPKWGDHVMADGTVVPGDKLKDYLGAAFNEQTGTINLGLLSEEQKKQWGFTKKDPLEGATAVAIQGSKPGGQSPVAQVQQDINAGGGGSTMLPASSVTPTQTVTPTTMIPTATETASGSGGGGDSYAQVAESVSRIDLSGESGGPTAADLATLNLQAFQEALANVHW